MKYILIILIVIFQIPSVLIYAENENPSPCIRLNELLPDPEGTDKGNEWIEIINICDKQIDLSSYYIEDASTGKYSLTGILEPLGLYLIFPSFSLNQTSETISLYEYDVLIDVVSYISSTTNKSISRMPDGTGQWLENRVPTPNQNNYKMYLSNVLISEVLPYSQDYVSWIELFSEEKEVLELDGWEINYSGNSLLLKDLVIKPSEYQVINLEDSLDPSGDIIKLLDPNGTIVCSFPYQESKKDISSIIYQEAVIQTKQPTPGKQNIYIDPLDKFFSLEELSIASFKMKTSGQNYIIEGSIVSKPGDIFKDRFYMMNGAEGIMVKLPNGAKEIKVGDSVRICASVDKYYSEITASINSNECIEIIDTPIDYRILNPENIENKTGTLVELNGIITKKDSSNIYIESDELEYKIYIKKLGRVPDLTIGDKILVTGFVNLRGLDEEGNPNIRVIAQKILLADISILLNGRTHQDKVFVENFLEKHEYPKLNNPEYKRKNIEYRRNALKSRMLRNPDSQFFLLSGIITNSSALTLFIKYFYSSGISSIFIH